MGAEIGIDKEALKNSSALLTRIISSNSNNILSFEKKELYEGVYNEAMGYCNMLVSNNCDPNIVPKAMNYLAAKHPFTLDKDNGAHWSYMLEVLLEITCPRVKSTDNAQLFLDDLEKALTRT